MGATDEKQVTTADFRDYVNFFVKISLIEALVSL